VSPKLGSHLEYPRPALVQALRRKKDQMPPEPPKTSLPPRCDAADPTPDTEDAEAPTCCWHHYMAYWLQRVAEEDDEKPQAPDTEGKGG